MLKEELMKLTQEQTKEFWEWCGFINIYYNGEPVWYLNGELYKSLPPIDLNNLFKYCVPEVLKVMTTKMFKNMPINQARLALFKLWLEYISQGFTDEEALFWASFEVLKKEDINAKV